MKTPSATFSGFRVSRNANASSRIAVTADVTVIAFESQMRNERICDSRDISDDHVDSGNDTGNAARTVAEHHLVISFVCLLDIGEAVGLGCRRSDRFGIKQPLIAQRRRAAAMHAKVYG